MHEKSAEQSPGPIALAFLLLLASAAATAEDDLQWSITPYLWAPTTSVDLRFRDAGIQGETRFKDLVDTLDAAFMLHVEAGRGQWSVFTDFTYTGTSETNLRGPLSIDSRNKQTTLDAAVAWWADEVGSGLSVFGGLRYTGFDDRYRFRLDEDGPLLGTRQSDSDYYDALIGARYIHSISDRWSLVGHSDLSFGDSEGSYLLRGLVTYSVGERRQNQIVFGYQYKRADFEDGDLETEVTFHGPMVGFNFRY